MGTIPASIDVQVIPGVLSAGGTALSTVGLFLDNLTHTPIAPLGEILSFPTAAAVEDYYGPTSIAAFYAGIYFAGFTGRQAIPEEMLFTQYPTWNVAAYLRGSALTSTLAQLQALTGSLTVVIDGYTHVISSISLASYGSFSAMATAIGAAFTDPSESTFTGSMGASFTASAGSPTTHLVVTSVTGYISAGDAVTGTGITGGTTVVSQVSGTTGGAGTYILSAANTASSASCTSTSAVIDVTAVASGVIEVGQTITGGSVQVGTIVSTQISGTTGGVGLYSTAIAGVTTQQASVSATLTGSATAPVVTYSSLSEGFVITSGITGVGSTAAYATGTLAASLQLTQATGAILSQGASATNPAAFMTAVTAQSENFVSYTTMFDPDAAFFTGSITTTTLTVDSVISGALAVGDTVTGPGVTANTIITALGTGTGGVGTYTVSNSQTITINNLASWAPGGGHGNTQKLAFSAWNNTVPDQFLYAMWDTDISPTLASPATGSAGYIVTTLLKNEGTVPIYQPSDLGHAAFLMGTIASINFNETQGRTNMKYRTQAGLVPAVTSETVAENLGSGNTQGPNGYNFVGVIGTAADDEIYWRNGQISGQFDWIDSYVNQIWLNSAMQLALIKLLMNTKSIPYNPKGINQINGTLTGGSAAPIALPAQSPVAAAINFGAIQPNVQLDAGQIEEVNNAAGLAIDSILSTRGWYLQVLPPPPTTRAARGSPVCNFWYTDGGSVNTINLNSIEIE